MKYAPEQIERAAKDWETIGAKETADVFHAYAALLRQQSTNPPEIGSKLVGGLVDEADIEAMRSASMEIKHNKESWFPMTERRLRHAAEALLSRRAALAQNAQGDGPLSSRLRPNVECAPWVIEAVKRLERHAERAKVPAGYCLVEKSFVSKTAYEMGARILKRCRENGSTDELTAVYMFTDMLLVAAATTQPKDADK